MVLTFNDSAGRFVDARGRFVSEAAVRSVIDAIADHASDRIAVASESLLAGRTGLGTWQAAVMADLKLAHLSAATIAHGGVDRMGFAEYGAIGRQIRDEYHFLRQFAEQIADGRQALNGSLISRARQYGQAARVTFEREYGRDQQRRGFQSCRNVLHAGESCSQCRAETARGWVPMGTLVPVGQRICRSNCRCTVTYRRESAAVAA